VGVAAAGDPIYSRQMRAIDVIVKKRDGHSLSQAEVTFFVDGVTHGTIPDYQISAWLMAVVLRGMSPQETAWLTDAMVHSGVRVDLRSIPGVKVDKHSTGGVGDKTSLILAPLAAACGVVVPMMSGRGLGHTGGTLDKLEAIPGFRVHLSIEEMMTALRRVGVAMIGQTAQIAPADKTLYAMRDVTGTVESIPLISASIMSKKIAEGIDALVLDVKTGRGAFMKTREASRALAQSLVSIGNASGVRTEALITAMDAPLGRAVGNAVEVRECIDVLKGGGPSDLVDVSVALTARMLAIGGVCPTLAEAEARVRTAIGSGAGLDRFRRIIEHQGGDPRVIDDPGRLPTAPRRDVLRSSRRGYIVGIDAGLVGRASVVLGAGRNRVEDPVDPSVGVIVLAKPGDQVAAGDGLFELHVADLSRRDAALALLGEAVDYGDASPAPTPLVLEEVR
jgi:pyrimidine-nucleoside phosphorylase